MTTKRMLLAYTFLSLFSLCADAQEPRIYSEGGHIFGLIGLPITNAITVINAPRKLKLRVLEGPGTVVRLSNSRWLWKCEDDSLWGWHHVVVGDTKYDLSTGFGFDADPIPEPDRLLPYRTRGHRHTEEYSTPPCLTVYSGMSNVLLERVSQTRGQFSLEFYVDSQLIAINDGQILDVRPELSQTEGRRGTLRVSYRFHCEDTFRIVREFRAKIAPPPLIVKTSNTIEQGDNLSITAYLGSEEDALPLPSLTLEPIAGFFDGGTVQMVKDTSEEYDFGWRPRVKHPAGESYGHEQYYFEFAPSASQRTITKKDGQDINVIVTDPLTHQTRNVIVHINPKRS